MQEYAESFPQVIFCVCAEGAYFHGSQVVILERRSQAGKVLFRSMSGGWNGSEEDKHRLHEQLELLQSDPAYLTTDATLPELNNEMAPVRPPWPAENLKDDEILTRPSVTLLKL